MGRSRAGFTLVEILIVTAIVAVLAGIAYALFGMAKTYSHKPSCLAHLKQLGAATHLYMADHDQNVPAKNPREGRVHGAHGVKEPIIDPLGPYGAVKALYHCPERSGRVDDELSDYVFRFVLDWSELNQNRAYSFRVQPQTGTVLASDYYHGHERNNILAPGNNWLILRDSGTVQNVKAGKIRKAYYHRDHWSLEPGKGAAMLIFPDEPFPLLERITR